MADETLIEELRQQIDQVATALVLKPLDPTKDETELAEALRAIQERAQSGGFADAVALSESMRQELIGGRATADTVGTALQRLQDCLTPAPVVHSLRADPELLSDFILESKEHLANVEKTVAALQSEPEHAESIHSLFRSFHSIKGLAGFLEISDVQRLAHDVETLLDDVRNGRLSLTASILDLMLESADWLGRRIDELTSAPDAPSTLECEPVRQRLCAVQLEHAAEADIPKKELEDSSAETPTAPACGGPARNNARLADHAVKVDTAKLDYLADMVGEMVIAQSIVRNDPDLDALRSPGLTRNLAQLGRITAEIQKTAMSMRLVPIGGLFRRMGRLVRDLGRKCGKAVQVELSGEDTELDRGIVEDLADPLMHMVRNAIDHGIELPQTRLAAGKPERARILLRAYHQGGYIIVELADDGAGLNRESILKKARSRGLSVDGLCDEQIWQLICDPGFSTAQQITDVSGRGVGMDVVKKHVQRLRGTLDIESVQGRGATFRLKLPLTLAIIEGLVVSVGGTRYIVPLFVVRETFRPSADTLFTVQGRSEMAIVRNELVPVQRLYKRFSITPRSEDPEKGILIVAEVESRRLCLLVDELIGKQEVVIKSLGETFRNVCGIAGGAILGDGRVGLILDVYGLVTAR